MSRKVIIVGAGYTGMQLARVLVNDGAHVVLVDRDSKKVDAARTQLDCTVVSSDGNSLQTLGEAGISSADALVALTDDDETNLIVCSLVDAEYPDILKIARVRNYAYYQRTKATERRKQDRNNSDLTNRPLFGVDRMLNPDYEAAMAITRAMHHGAVGNVTELSGGYGIVSLPILPGCALDGKAIRDLSSLEGWKYFITYVEKPTGAMLPDGSTELKTGDRVGVLTHLDSLSGLLKLMGNPAEEEYESVAIFGADRVGTLVADKQFDLTGASAFQRAYGKSRVKAKEIIMVDRDSDRCREAAARFEDARILCGDITDADLVSEEALDSCDLMVAASGNYESNLVMAAYLKSRGVKRTIALTSSGTFDDVAHKLGVDVAVPMRDTVVDCIVSHLRGKGVKSIHTACNRMFEIVECEISAGAYVDGKAVREISSSGEFLILLVHRPGSRTFDVAGGNTILRAASRVVIVAKAGDTAVLRRFVRKV